MECTAATTYLDWHRSPPPMLYILQYIIFAVLTLHLNYLSLPLLSLLPTSLMDNT